MQDKEYRINDSLPESLDTGNMHEIAKTVDKALRKIDALSEIVNLYPHIDKLSSRLVDALAIQFHCDVYDTSLPLDIRRQIVKKSVPWHIRKGTAAVVEEVVATIFGAGASVQEWFEYGGEPYRFRVTVENASITRESVSDMRRAIERMKNVRSWLDMLNFTLSFRDDESENVHDLDFWAASLFSLSDDVPYGIPIKADKHDGARIRGGTICRKAEHIRDGTLARCGFDATAVPRWGKHIDYIFRSDGKATRDGTLQHDGRLMRRGEKPWRIEYSAQMEDFSALLITLAKDDAATFEDTLDDYLPRNSVAKRDGNGRHGLTSHPVDSGGALTITRARQRNGRIRRDGGDINLHDGSIRRNCMFRRDGGGTKRRIDVIHDAVSGGRGIRRPKKEAPLRLKYPELDDICGAARETASMAASLSSFADSLRQRLTYSGSARRDGSCTRGMTATAYESGGIEIIKCRTRSGSINRAGGFHLAHDGSLIRSGKTTHDKGGNTHGISRQYKAL